MWWSLYCAVKKKFEDMLHVSPACFCLFLEAPFRDYDLFLIFFISHILHSFDKSCNKIRHPKHLNFKGSYFFLQLCYLSFRIANPKNSLVFERFKVFSKSPAAMIFLLEIGVKIWWGMPLKLLMDELILFSLGFQVCMCLDMPFTWFFNIPWSINSLSHCSIGLFPDYITNFIDIQLWRAFSYKADIIIMAELRSQPINFIGLFIDLTFKHVMGHFVIDLSSKIINDLILLVVWFFQVVDLSLKIT